MQYRQALNDPLALSVSAQEISAVTCANTSLRIEAGIAEITARISDASVQPDGNSPHNAAAA
jgi:hypothetical protein